VTLKSIIAGLILCASLSAATLERLSTDEMISKSTAIVRGKVLSSRTAFRGPMIYTYSRVQVLERWKGAEASEVEVATPGGKANGMEQTFSGAPALAAGSEYMLFLWTGKSGMTQVIGLSQGVFDIKLSKGVTMVARPASTEAMLDPITKLPVADESVLMPLRDMSAKINRVAAGGSR
jgi:hypothetical protein